MKKSASLSVVLTLILSLLSLTGALAQAVSTIKAGAWNDPTVWSTGTIPNSSFGAITIKHAVTVPSSYSPIGGGVLVADQITVTVNVTTGSLTINSGAEMTLNNGAGADLTLSLGGTVVVNGNLIANTGVTYAGLTAANSSFNSGSSFEYKQTNIGTAATVPTALWDPNSTFLLSGVANGTATAQWKQDFGHVTINSTAPLGTVNFAGFLGSNGGSGAGSIKGNFEILASGTGIISLNSTGTSTGASGIFVTGHVLVSGGSRLELTTTGATELNVMGDFTLSANTGSISSTNSSGAGTVRLGGTSSFNVSSGTWSFASGGANGTGVVQTAGNVTITGGTVQESGTGTASGTFSLSGNSSNLTFAPAQLGVGTVGFTISKTAGQQVNLQTDLTISGALAMSSGSLVLGGHILIANGILSQAGGLIDASTSSQFFIAGAGAADVAFAASSTFSTFELNRAGAMTTATSFSVNNLHLFNGTLTVNNPGILTMLGAGTITRQTGALTNVPAAGGPFNVVYNDAGALTSGGELPTNATDLLNLTKMGAGALTLNAAITTLTINGDLTTSAGSLLGNSKNITLIGNFISNAVFTAGGGTFTFDVGSGSLSGTIAPTFNIVVVNRTMSTGLGFRVNSDFTLSTGTFTATAGIASFGGTSTITNSGTALNLNAVDILANSTLTAPTGTLGIAGDFTATNATSTFTNNGGTILFNGSSNLLGTGTKTFNDISVSGTLMSAVNFTLAGNLINNGTISLTAGTMMVSGASKTWTGTPVSTIFFITTVSGSVTSSIAFTSNGLFTVSGTFVSNNGFTTTAGLTIPAAASFTANTTPFTVGGVFTLTGTGTFTEGAGATGTFLGNIAGTGALTLTTTTTFGGATAISGTGAKTFASIIVSTGNSLGGAIGLRVNGDITNNGTILFTAGTLNFGGAAQAINGTPVSTSFFTTTISATSTVTSSIPLKTSGVFTVNGKLNANAGFTASVAMTVTGAGSAVVVTTSPYSVGGTLTVTNPGTFSATNSGANGTLSGNLAVTGTLSALSSTTFAGTTTLTGASANKNFGDILITGTLTPNNIYNIAGNLSLSGAGTLNAGTSTTTFNGTTLISNSGSGTVSFNSLTVSAGKTVTANADITISGLTMSGSGSFASTGNTTFSRAGTTTITGTGTKAFGTVTINGGTTVTPNAPYSIAADLNVTGILGAGNNTVTFNGTTAITITNPGTVTFNSVIINPLSTLTSDPTTVTINGNFADNGTFNHNNGTIVFTGNLANRSLSGSSVTGFNNITIVDGTQATDLFVSSNKDLFGVLTLAANARMDPDGAANTAVFTLRSTSDSPSVDASIAALPSPGLAPAQINGKITVQRYTSGEGRIYRYIGTPVIGASVASWQDNFYITGTFTDPSNPGVVCGKTVKSTSPSLFTYSEATDLYVAYPISGLAASNPLTVGVGYAAFVRECSAPIVIDVSGSMANTVNIGTVNLPVTFTAGKTNYNLVGNPYPSAIDFDNFVGGSTNMSSTIAIRDNGTGNFQYWTNTTPGVNGSGGIPNGVITSGQAFWIQSTGAGPVLTTTEASKVPSPAAAGNTFFRTITTDPDLLQITATGSTQAVPDIAYVYQIAAAHVGADQWDATKLDNYVDDPFVQLFDLYTTMDNAKTKLAVNALPAVNCNTKMNLALKDSKAGTYTYTFNTFGAIRDLQVQLYDKFANQTMTITDNGAYSFSITTDTASSSTSRFQLMFSEVQANLNLLVDGTSNVCTPTGATNVIVKSAEHGVSYFAMLGNSVVSDTLSGNGIDLSLSVANSSLKTGLNHFTIQALQTCGQYTLSKSFDLTKDSTAIAIAKTGSHCRDGSVTLTASGAPALGSYNWYTLPDTTNAIAGQNGNEFTTPDLPKSQTYYVAAINSNGCVGPKVLVQAEIINYNDATITLVQSSTLVQLQSNFNQGNHWSLDGSPLTDTTKVLVLESAGRYTLDVTIQDCVTSTDRVVTPDVVAGLDDPIQGVRAFPNPVAGVLSVEVSSKNTATNAVLSNITGLSIGNISLSNQGNVKLGQYDFSQLPPGMYYIQVGAGDGQRVLKIIRK